jgi:RHS repeat-associated protein
VIQNGKTYQVISNQVGSPLAVLDSQTAALVGVSDYDDFGVPVLLFDPKVMPFGFAGGIWDPDTRLVHFGARDYEPDTGTWLSQDPIGFGGRQTNLYQYVQNNPLKYIDPRGLDGVIYDGSSNAVIPIPENGGPSEWDDLPGGILNVYSSVPFVPVAAVGACSVASTAAPIAAGACAANPVACIEFGQGFVNGVGNAYGYGSPPSETVFEGGGYMAGWGTGAAFQSMQPGQ